jgi:CheY-like chemotaxis protein
MNGSLKVESKLGQGTEFKWNIWVEEYSLPKARPSPVEIAYSAPTTKPHPFPRGYSIEGGAMVGNKAQQARVLLAEDNQLNSAIIKKLLEAQHFEVDTASTGREVLEKVKGKLDYHDVILMDFGMPDMDGISTTNELRQLGIRIPVIGLTANADEQVRTEALRVGMRQLLTKPAKGEELKAAVNNALEESLKWDMSQWQ